MSDMIVTEYAELLKRKTAIETELASLPQGYISHKIISGKEYSYLQNRVMGKMVSSYLKGDETDRISSELRQRKQLESELPEITSRLDELEQAAKLLGHGIDRKLMLLKLSMGMDEIDADRKKLCASFANAMNAIEGVPVSEQTSRDIGDWQNGTRSYLSVFQATLQRYGFPAEV